MRFRLPVLGSLVFALAVVALPTSANAQTPPPTTTIVPIDSTFVDNTCGFPIVEHLTGKWITTDFFDEQGHLVLRQRHILLSGTLTNPATGTVLTEREALNASRDFTTGTFTRHGLQVVVTAPGTGVVLLDAGTFVTDAGGNVVFEAGPHQVLNGDFAEFCAAMT